MDPLYCHQFHVRNGGADLVEIGRLADRTPMCQRLTLEQPCWALTSHVSLLSSSPRDLLDLQDLYGLEDFDHSCFGLIENRTLSLAWLNR